MKNKLSLLATGFILVIIITLIIGIPKLYFLSNDQSTKNNYTIRSLNLMNVYDHIQLSNEKKIELLMDSNTKLFSIEEKISSEEYAELMKKIRVELKKIDDDTLQLFDELFYCNFEDLVEITVVKEYLSNEEYDSFSVKRIDYFTESIEVSILLDANDYTIFNFTGSNYVALDTNGEFEEVELTNDYRKYLQLSKNNSNVFGYRTNYSIELELDIFSKKDTSTNEINDDE